MPTYSNISIHEVEFKESDTWYREFEYLDVILEQMKEKLASLHLSLSRDNFGVLETTKAIPGIGCINIDISYQPNRNDIIHNVYIGDKLIYAMYRIIFAITINSEICLNPQNGGIKDLSEIQSIIQEVNKMYSELMTKNIMVC